MEHFLFAASRYEYWNIRVIQIRASFGKPRAQCVPPFRGILCKDIGLILLTIQLHIRLYHLGINHTCYSGFLSHYLTEQFVILYILCLLVFFPQGTVLRPQVFTTKNSHKSIYLNLKTLISTCVLNLYCVNTFCRVSCDRTHANI